MHILKTLSLVVILSLVGCSSAASPADSQLTVVATTQIVADVASAIAGDLLTIQPLIPAGTDPHSFEPSPQDVVLLSSAEVILVNGLNLEESLAGLLETVDGETIAVSDGVTTLEVEEHEEEHLEDEEEHDHEGADPHVWMSPLNVKTWADNIAAALSQADPQNAAAYAANAAAYKAELDELDLWAQDTLGAIQAEDRVLVTDHEALAYFADHYGFEVVGALIPSSTTLSEPAAGALADLQQAIHDSRVKAIFIGTSTNPNLAQQVAADTGVDLVVIYTESLSEAEGPAATYLEMMRYNIEAIVQALN